MRPANHDVLADDGRRYLDRHGNGTKGSGWFKAGGLGNLGADQLAWLETDLKGRSSSTPVVVFAHTPLWSVYPEFGWGTDDGAQASIEHSINAATRPTH